MRRVAVVCVSLAAIWTVLLFVGAAKAPLYSGSSTTVSHSGTQVTKTTSATSLEANGPRVFVLLALPAVAVLLTAGLSWHSNRATAGLAGRPGCPWVWSASSPSLVCSASESSFSRSTHCSASRCSSSPSVGPRPLSLLGQGFPPRFRNHDAHGPPCVARGHEDPAQAGRGDQGRHRGGHRGTPPRARLRRNDHVGGCPTCREFRLEDAP